MTCSKKIRPVTGLSSTWVRENSACSTETSYRYPAAVSSAVNGHGSSAGPLGGQVPDDRLIEGIADRLHRGGVIDGGEPVVQRREPDPGPGRHGLGVLVAVAAQLGVIGEIAAVLQEERPRAGVAAVEIPLGDHPALPHDPRVGVPLRVPPPGRGQHAHLLLRPADEHHALGPARGQEPRQVLAHHVVLALPGLELHHRDAVAGRRTRGPPRRTPPVRFCQHGGGGHRLAQVLPDEPHHAQVALQLRHVQVAVDRGRCTPARTPHGGPGHRRRNGVASSVAPVGQARTGQLPPQAVIYRDTSCHRHDPAGAPFRPARPPARLEQLASPVLVPSHPAAESLSRVNGWPHRGQAPRMRARTSCSSCRTW